MTKEKILQFAVKFFKKHNRFPKRVDFEQNGITHNMIKHYYVNYKNLNEQLTKELNLLTLENLNTISGLRTVAKNSTTYIITTAVSGCRVNTNFIKALKNYARRNKAKILILPILNKDNTTFDPQLNEFTFIKDFFQLNDNCVVLNLKPSAKTLDPTNGLGPISKNQKTLIIPGVELRLRFVPNGINNFPKAIMTTGTVTLPDFLESKFDSKQSFIVANSITFSATLVEVEDEKHFHFRQLIANKKGFFSDLGKYYTDTDVKTTPCSLVLGDWHCGKTNESLREKTLELTKVLKPEFVVLHDMFDGYSISHHEVNKAVVRAKKAFRNDLSLQKELENYALELHTLAEKHNLKLVIVKSNHDEHLERYLDEVRFKDDPLNFEIASSLISYVVNELNPLEQYTLKKFKNLEKKVKWLKRDESFQFRNSGVELGAHGDKGANGSYPSLAQLAQSYGDVVIGHRHTPEIKGKVWVVGTSTHLKLDYNLGPSSWVNTHCIVYEDGTRQLLNFINGKFSVKFL